MKKIRTSTLALALLVALPALAATDGNLSDTSSTATFKVTANGPQTNRQVQVRGASDFTVTNSTFSELNGSTVGGKTNFCVVDTWGGATTLQVSTGNTLSGANWRLAPNTTPVGTTPTGSTPDITYTLKLTNLANTTNYLTAGNDGANNKTANLPAGVAVTDSTLCGAGNLKAHVDLNLPMPNTYPFNSYDDTLTMVLSPV